MNEKGRAVFPILGDILRGIPHCDNEWKIWHSLSSVLPASADITTGWATAGIPLIKGRRS